MVVGEARRQGQKSIYHLYLDALGGDVELFIVAAERLLSKGCCFDLVVGA